MSKKQKTGYRPHIFRSIILPIILFVILIAVLVYNFTVKPKDNFFEMSFGQGLSIAVGLLVTSILGGYRSVSHRYNEKMAKYVSGIQLMMGNFDEEDEISRKSRKNVLIARSIGNKIEFLRESYHGPKEISDMIADLGDEFIKLREVLDESVVKLEDGKVSRKDIIINAKVRVDDVCDHIIMRLM